jgi:hypothetical protein
MQDRDGPAIPYRSRRVSPGGLSFGRPVRSSRCILAAWRRRFVLSTRLKGTAEAHEELPGKGRVYLVGVTRLTAIRRSSASGTVEAAVLCEKEATSMPVTSDEYKEAAARLPEDLRPVIQRFVEEYEYWTMLHSGRGYVANKVFADLVLEGWRPSAEKTPGSLL